jgi:hypothetical protein
MCDARARERKQAYTFACGFQDFGGVEVASTLLCFEQLFILWRCAFRYVFDGAVGELGAGTMEVDIQTAAICQRDKGYPTSECTHVL